MRLFCVDKAPLAPLIVNGIIPHTSCIFLFTTGYEPGDLPEALLLPTIPSAEQFQTVSSITLVAQITKNPQTNKRYSTFQTAQSTTIQRIGGDKVQRKTGRDLKPRPSLNRGTP